MQKKLLFLLLTLFLAAGCQAKSSTSNTPEDALNQLHEEEGYAEVIKVYRTLEVDNNRVISVYKGVMNDTEEIFIAKVNQSKEEGWKVTDAIGMGMPTEENISQNTSTSTFQAGYILKNSAPSPNTKTVEIDDSKYKVWVKVDK